MNLLHLTPAGSSGVNMAIEFKADSPVIKKERQPRRSLAPSNKVRHFGPARRPWRGDVQGWRLPRQVVRLGGHYPLRFRTAKFLLASDQRLTAIGVIGESRA